MQERLIEEFLERNSNILQSILDKTLREKKISQEEMQYARDLSHASNILTSIHLFRTCGPDLGEVLNQMSPMQRVSLEGHMRIIWSRLLALNDIEISDLVMETIQDSSRITDRISSFGYY